MISDQCKKEYFSKVFTEFLNQWKREHNKSQADFADIIGAHPNSISRYKKAQDFPNESTLGAIAKEFGVSVDVFYPSTDTDKFLYDPNYKFGVTFKWAGLFNDVIEKYDISRSFYNMLADSTDKFIKFNFEHGPCYKQLWFDSDSNKYLSPGDSTMQAHVMTTMVKQKFYDTSISVDGEINKAHYIAIDMRTQPCYMIGFTENDLIHIKELQDKTTEYLNLLNIKSLMDSRKLKVYIDE